MSAQERTGRRLRRFRFRTSVGVPVSCEIYVERDPFGELRILRAVEVERSSGNLILSQSEVEETEVLSLYRQWRRRPENQDRIQRVNVESMFTDYQILSRI